MTPKRKNKLKRELQEARYRLEQVNKHFAEPLRDMIFVAVEDVYHMSTNGQCIYFDANWLQKLGDKELDFMLSHQLMHISLNHINRPKICMGDRFHLACDVVANSNLELYGWNYEKLANIGKIYYETFYPSFPGRDLSAVEAVNYIPFDPAMLSDGKRRKYMIDSEKWWDIKDDRGEAGVIVLSPEDEDPDDLEFNGYTGGYEYVKLKKERFVSGSSDEEQQKEQQEQSEVYGYASQFSWESEASEVLAYLRNDMTNEKNIGYEDVQQFRIPESTKSSDVKWKDILISSIQEELSDYSFTPPDRRLQDCEFFLPDFNVYIEKPKHILFMVDTSGSVTDETLSVVFGEIGNALEQFEGMLECKIGFFDVNVYEPVPFSTVDELYGVEIIGGGGTDFQRLFKYINKMPDPPANIIIFTDGFGEFPDENECTNIPVLWLILGTDVVPPYGKYAYVDI